MRVDVLDGRGAFRALAPAWEKLAGDAGGAPFLQPGWAAIAALHLARAPRRLRVLAAHEGGALAGVLPLLVEKRRIAGVPARVYRSLSDDHSQRFDLVARDEAAVASLWRALADDRGWDVLELRDVPPDGARADRLAALAAADGFPCARWESQRSPWLALPATAEALDAALSSKFRANLRRRKKNLAREHGPVELERVDGGPALADALADGFALEACGWKGAAATAIERDPLLTLRYRALARWAARRGELALHFLRVSGRRVAFHFAVEAAGVYYLFKPGYDEALARHGVGQLLTWEVMRALCGRARTFDFLGEDMPWKRDWTAEARAHAWRYVFRPTPFGRALHGWKFALVPAARRLMAMVRPPASDGDAPAREDA